MESKGLPGNRSNNREKRVKRKEILEKKKAVDELIKSASADKGPLASFPPFRRFERNEKVKHREMVAPEARYIFVHEAPGASTCEILTSSERKRTCTNFVEDKNHGWIVQHRFILEEDAPVLYVYELQLKPHVRAMGLGKFLMRLIKLIASKNHKSAVMLTVQKANSLAMDFYLNKLRYVISTVSPSRADPWIGIEKRYEILCKAFDHEAKTILEETS